MPGTPSPSSRKPLFFHRLGALERKPERSGPWRGRLGKLSRRRTAALVPGRPSQVRAQHGPTAPPWGGKMAPRGAIPSPTEPLRDVPQKNHQAGGLAPAATWGGLGTVADTPCAGGRRTLCRWLELPRPCVGLRLTAHSPTRPLVVRFPLHRPHRAGQFLLEHRCSNHVLQGSKVGNTRSVVGDSWGS